MTLKFKIDSPDDVDEQYRGLYEKSGDGHYRLAVDGVDDVAPLKRAKEREKEARLKAEQEKKELAERFADLERKIKDGEYVAAKDKGDVEALEKSWQEKLANREAELTEQLQSTRSALTNQLIESATEQIAAIFVAPKTQKAYVSSRLSVEIVDGKPVIRVLDEAGKPTAMNLEEFRESLKNDPDLAPVTVGSKAAGAGATGGGGGGGGVATKDWSKASMKEKVAHIKAKQAG